MTLVVGNESDNRRLQRVIKPEWDNADPHDLAYWLHEGEVGLEFYAFMEWGKWLPEVQRSADFPYGEPVTGLR
jgi:hypothetical protein